MISALLRPRVNGLVSTWPLKSTEYGLKKFTNPPRKRRKPKKKKNSFEGWPNKPKSGKARKTKEEEKIQFLKKTLACWFDLVNF